MEIPAGDDVALVGKDQRIVADRVAFALDDIGGVAQLVECRAHHLRLAAQGIGILHPVAIDVAGAQGAAFHQRQQGARCLDLPQLAAHRMDAWIERRIAAQRRISRHGASDEARAPEIVGREQPRCRQRRRDLGAVEQGEPLLGGEIDRLQPGDLQAFDRGQNLAFVADLADAEQDRGEMRQRRQIARRADRALGWNARIDFRIHESDQRIDHAAPYARETARQAVDLEDQDGAHDGIGQRLSRAGGMAQDQATLQFGELVVLDAGAGQRAEAGIDAIGGLAPVDHRLDHRRRSVDGAVARGIEGDRARLVDQRAQLLQRQGSGIENESAGHALASL